ncbi:MAG: hypothetical protein RMK97_10270, partial [Sutterellaceae bacterium]|nr:hypothetical protein [Burkholderiaceae bacterium]MDW8430867.1 hypothetical protein [Sutterellaceae bacterium]
DRATKEKRLAELRAELEDMKALQARLLTGDVRPEELPAVIARGKFATEGSGVPRSGLVNTDGDVTRLGVLAELDSQASRLPPSFTPTGARPSRQASRNAAIRAKYEELARAGRRNYVKEIKRTVPGADSLSDRRIRDIVKGR